MRKEKLKVYLPESTPINDFESILSQFSNWTEFKREIKLLSILQEKKIEYKVENILSQKPIYGLLEGESEIIEIKRIAFIVKEMIFTIQSGNILELKVDIETFETESGKLLDTLFDANIDLQLKYRVSKNGDISYFYLDFPNLAA